MATISQTVNIEMLEKLPDGTFKRKYPKTSYENIVGSPIYPPSIITQDASNRFVTDAEKAAWNGKAASSHAHDGRYLQLTGGTLTGNLTGKYITGTWLQATAVADLSRTAGKVAVLDDSGWVYYRTVAELLADLGIPDAVKAALDEAKQYTDTAIGNAIAASY